jgi:hypothetical protein
MVKNLNTIDRSERIRIGKHVPDEQAINTIIINASSNVVEAPQGGFYVSPVRLNNSILSNTLCYDVTSKEIVDSGKTINLQGVSETGNTTTETLQFTNNTTGFITTSNVGIANSAPNHTLSVGGDAYITGNLTVVGQTTAIRTENTTIKDAILELGENNVGGIDLGILMTRPSSNIATVYIESTDEYAIGYTQNSATDTHVIIDTSNAIEMRVYGNITGDYITADGSNIANVVKYDDLSANVALLRTDIDSNVSLLRNDLQSNISITESTLRSEMTANTNALRADLQSNISITESTLRSEMTANTNALRADLQSNISNTESTLRSEMTANTNALRADLQSNISITESTLRGEMTANTNALRADLQSNISITESTLRSEMTANTNALRADLQSNISITESTLRNEMAGNTLALRNDLQSNISITESTLRSEMAANTVTLRNEIALKSNINNPVFTGIITGDGGAISNISLQHVTEYGNSSDQTIELTNTLSLVTFGNVGVNVNNPQRTLHVGGEILADDDITGVDFYGDDATFTGGLTVSGDTLFYGNLEVRGNTTYLSTQNLLVEDPILALGANNTSSSLDTGLIVLVYEGNSNVAFGYRGASNEFIISHTLSSPDDGYLVPDTSNVINVHVYGDVTADTYRGDGGILSNVTLQVVTDKGNTTSNTLQFTNSHTAFTTDLTSNVEVKLDQLSNVVITSPQADHLLMYDGSNWVNDYNLHNFIKVHNTTGSTLYRGNTVYIVDSFNNNVANVALAKSDSSSTMPAIGLIHEDIANGEEGTAVAYGKVSGIDTTGFVEGQTVYVSNVGAGLVMNSKPYGLTDQIQNVGICIKVHQSNGVIFVTGVGRSNDIPNAPISSSPNYVYVNETNNDMKKIAPSNLLTKLQTLEQVVNTGNTVSNSIEITGNLTVSQNVSIGGITANHFPIVGTDGYLKASTISVDNGATVIASNLEVTGDIIVTGNSYVIESNTVTIEDRIIGIAVNNPSHDLDTGIIMEHPGHNIALVHHGDEDRFSIGYTQNTTSDNHVLPDSNIFYLDVLGNVVVQNNMTVGSGGSYFGDGTTLTGVALETDLVSNVSRISVLESDLASNASRVGVLELRDFDDAVNIGNVTSNTIQLINTDVGLVATGNIQAARFIGDGSYLTGLVTTFEDVANNGNTSSNTIQLTNADVGLVVTGNVEAARFIGDGSYLTGLVTTFEDVANNGNTSSNTIQLTNADVGLVVTGNVEAARFIGDGSYLTGLVTTFEDVANNGNTSSNTIQLTNADVGLKADGNIQANYFIGDGSYLTGLVTTLEDVANNGNTSSNTILLTNADVGLKADGNIQANYFIGDGSRLDNIASNLEEIVLNGNVTTQTIHIENVVSLTTTGNVGIANTNPTCDLAVGSNVCFNDISSNILTVDGNILAHRITLDSIQIASVYALEYVTMEGNTTSNTVEFTNSVTGLVTTANVGIANSSPIHTLDVGSNLWVDEIGSNVLYVNGNVHVDGSQLTTAGKVGIGNTAPGHDLSVASNLYVEDVGSNVLVVNGNASIGTTLTLGAIEITSAYNLEEVTGEGNVTSNVIQFTNSNVGAIVTGGLVVNDGSYKCKHYAYSNVSVPTDFANVAMTFASNVFHAKITAQLTHGNEEVSTLVLDVQGGTRDGTTSSLNIATGTGSVFGNTNTKPWSGAVSTTPTKVILEPSATGTTAYGVDVYIEYKSSSSEGKLESISIGTDTVKSFVY